jgi:methylated-DNA-[protein]-cysteine S-methyltransferase
MTVMNGVEETCFLTPWGPGTVIVVDGRPAEVRLPDMQTTEPDPCPTLSDAEPDARGGKGARWARELDRYFAGTKLSWEAGELPLHALGLTSFRLDVYHALLRVPAGVTISYEALAELAGHPRAARAVGSAMAQNPLPILIPCHRVVRSDGSLGRYGTCDAWKPWLLEHEGRVGAHGPGGPGA